MLVRQRFEGEYARLFETTGYGTTNWSPLCMGLLTGKYNDGVIPEGSRFAVQGFLGRYWDLYFSEGKKEKTIAMFKGIKDIADEMGVTQAQLALGWAIANKDVSTAICGYSQIE